MISEQIGLDLLRTYVAVCRQGSLSKVAAQTGRTQSALSMQMRRLEGLLERHLFQRTGRGVVPTAEGEIFLGYATRMLALGDEATARLQQKEIKGGVRIGLAEEVATTALPAALGRLHRAYPDIRLDVVVEHSVALGRLWGEDGLDIMLGPTSVVTADALAAWTVELQWVCAPDHAPDPGRPLDLVAFTAPCLWRRRMIEALAAAGREHRVIFTSQSVTALQAAVENGLGVGVLPSDSVRPGSMKVLKAGVPGPLAAQYGLFARDRRPPVVEAAIGVLREGLPAAAPRP
ncbi:LysR substrate-binding domain-containing protein [Inquilinus sp. OTU3971]|uniref:LysR substrate-binding domain-containing protein n=1 Tax=Inquilinus sp. OTU3971 TaxID=3043855 RepID=UPI00313E24DB